MSLIAPVQIAATRVTAAGAIYRQLRAAILGMDLLPGAALADRELSARFAVSRTPVREALIRLAEEGLVDIRPQAGTFVSRIRVEAIAEALDQRLALERMTVRRAAAAAGAGGTRGIAHLDAALAEQMLAAGRQDSAAFHAADEAFHEALARLGGRMASWRLVQTIKQDIDRTRRLTLPVPGRMDQVIVEHRAIREAVAAGKQGLADQDMVAHLTVLLPDITDLRRHYPLYFV